MSLGIFCGENHHKSTIIFIVGFLSNETIDSFVWLFTEFKKCMGKAAPLTIITNQDTTMKAALQMVFPYAFHRLFKWHITDKMGEKIGIVYKNHSAMDEFFSLLNESESILEFEHRWGA